MTSRASLATDGDRTAYPVLPVLAALLVCGCSAPSVPRSAAAASVAPARAVEAAREARPEIEDFETATVGSLPPGWAVAGSGTDVAFAAAKGDAGVVLQLEATTDARGTVTNYSYDADHLTEVVEDFGNGLHVNRTSGFTYHSPADDWVTHSEEPGVTTDYTYDANGNVLTSTATELWTQKPMSPFPMALS